MGTWSKQEQQEMEQEKDVDQQPQMEQDRDVEQQERDAARMALEAKIKAQHQELAAQLAPAPSEQAPTPPRPPLPAGAPPRQPPSRQPGPSGTQQQQRPSPRSGATSESSKQPSSSEQPSSASVQALLETNVVVSKMVASQSATLERQGPVLEQVLERLGQAASAPPALSRADVASLLDERLSPLPSARTTASASEREDVARRAADAAVTAQRGQSRRSEAAVTSAVWGIAASLAHLAATALVLAAVLGSITTLLGAAPPWWKGALVLALAAGIAVVAWLLTRRVGPAVVRALRGARGR